jgi:hypothetical protein
MALVEFVVRNIGSWFSWPPPFYLLYCNFDDEEACPFSRVGLGEEKERFQITGCGVSMYQLEAASFLL